jgi:hypothetical protein
MPTSNPYGLRVGQRVRTTMGIPTAGRVVRYVPRNQYTDGQYRYPMSHERAVYTKWDDGTQGWSHRGHIMGENPGQRLEEVKRLAKIRHEKERKAARRRGRKDFPMLPYECSWAFEEEFKRKHGRNPELLIVGNPPPQAFDVYLNGKLIDTVFYSPNVSVDAEEVRRSLINHDGYDHRIVVRKTRKGRNPMRRQRRRSRNSWKGHRAAHRKAALKGWRRRRRSRKGRKKYAKSGKKFIRFGGQKISWKGLVRRKGVKGAMKIWRKRRKIGGRR